MNTQRKAKTIRLTEQDWKAIALIKEHYGITSDTDAIRFALRELLRNLERQELKPNTPNYSG